MHECLEWYEESMIELSGLYSMLRVIECEMIVIGCSREVYVWLRKGERGKM